MSSYQTHSSITIRPETPPNTPQRVRIAAQQAERDSRVLDSPEHRHLSEPHSSRIAPPRFHLPNIPAPLPAGPSNNVDPFAAPGQSAVLNGQTYNNLPAGLAAQVAAVAAMAPMPALRQRRGRRAAENPAPPPPVPLPVRAPPVPVYHHLPNALAAQLAALNAMPAPQPLRNYHPAPAPAPPPPVQTYAHLPGGLAAQVAALPEMPARPPYQHYQAPAPFPMPPPLPDQPDELPLPIDPPPLPNNTDALPQACQPFNPNWPVHSLGKMDVVCPNCHALHWMSERLVNSTNQTPLFGMCCTSGKIKLPKLADPPGEILNLLSGQDHMAKKFRENIRKYNNALAMTSLGCTVDESVNRNGAGPYVFKVHGQLSHKAGSLLPNEGQTPLYSQLYIYDGGEALDYRMGHIANHNLDRRTMQTLQDTLHNHHPGVAMYKQALELTANLPPEQQCKIALRFDERTDRRRYNLPTAAAGNEIAVILPGDGDQPQDSRDLILYRHHGQPLQRISEMHPMYLPLHYVLLFPTGQLGWHKNMLRADAPDVPEAADQDDDQNPIGNGQVSRKRRYITQMEWFCYRLFPHVDESLHIFMSGKLLQEFIVDAWAITEQSRLTFIKLNQAKLRVYHRQGIADAIASDPTVNTADLGQRIILPSSFSGSTRNMIQHCQDALAINRYYHGADLFITITANPNWPQIKEALLP